MPAAGHPNEEEEEKEAGFIPAKSLHFQSVATCSQ